MASKNLFASKSAVSASLTVNEAGGKAYEMPAKEALAQLAVTGCFNNTFYASGQNQLDKVKELVKDVDPTFLAKLAVYSRERGYMKDMPSFLVGYLSGLMTQAAKAEEAALKLDRKAAARVEADKVREISAVLTQVFPRVVDNGRMLRNYVQMIRSGETGRKSFGSSPKKLVRSWFTTKTDEQVFYNSIGNDPSLADVIKLTRPVPSTKERAALYGYFLGKDTGLFNGESFSVAESIPGFVQRYEAFKADLSGSLPKVPFEMLLGLPLKAEQWKELALQATWTQTRMNLNNFLKRGVFGSAETGWDTAMIKAVADKLRDEKQIERAKVMPYQLLMAFKNTGVEMPVEITNALQDAMEFATRNVPVVDGLVAIFPDISGSMHSPVTGYQVNPKTGKTETHTSKVQCIDVAALVAASVLRANPNALVLPFSDDALTNVKLNPRDSVMTNADKLSALPSGGTNCSAPMRVLNQRGIVPTLVWYVSDNESWLDNHHNHYGYQDTGTATEWAAVEKRAPNAKLVCMDIQPYTTTQAQTRPNVMNVGGFSDSVFDVVKSFCSGGASDWVSVIEQTNLSGGLSDA